jgi:hypothetical protein
MGLQDICKIELGCLNSYSDPLFCSCLSLSALTAAHLAVAPGKSPDIASKPILGAEMSLIASLLHTLHLAVV